LAELTSGEAEQTLDPGDRATNNVSIFREKGNEGKRMK
jgi:hypothetical protein